MAKIHTFDVADPVSHSADEARLESITITGLEGSSPQISANYVRGSVVNSVFVRLEGLQSKAAAVSALSATSQVEALALQVLAALEAAGDLASGSQA